jgi:hypothetical protein
MDTFWLRVVPLVVIACLDLLPVDSFPPGG